MATRDAGALLPRAAAFSSRAGSAVASLLDRHRLTILAGGAVVLLSYFLPLPPLPLPPSRYPETIGLALSSLAFAAAWSIWRRRPVPWGRLPAVVVAALAATLFFDGFLRWKACLPIAMPFRWDARLAEASAWLHGGRPLSAWLTPVLGAPWSLRLLDGCYALWFPVMAGGILYQAWRDDREAARRFALAWVLTWMVLGILLAYAVSSAGPIFLQQLHGDDRFAPLLALAQGLALRSTATAGSLWHWSQTLGVSSISAFPSLHVAVPVLFACATRGWLRGLSAAFAVLIFLGSVMLGWHYALDGYASALLAPLLWALAGRLTPRTTPGSCGAAGHHPGCSAG